MNCVDYVVGLLFLAMNRNWLVFLYHFLEILHPFFLLLNLSIYGWCHNIGER